VQRPRNAHGTLFYPDTESGLRRTRALAKNTTLLSSGKAGREIGGRSFKDLARELQIADRPRQNHRTHHFRHRGYRPFTLFRFRAPSHGARQNTEQRVQSIRESPTDRMPLARGFGPKRCKYATRARRSETSFR
jgi:hypothetical protein